MRQWPEEAPDHSPAQTMRGSEDGNQRFIVDGTWPRMVERELDAPTMRPGINSNDFGRFGNYLADSDTVSRPGGIIFHPRCDFLHAPEVLLVKMSSFL